MNLKEAKQVLKEAELEIETNIEITSEMKEEEIIIKDSENAGYDKIAYANTEDSRCYCFILDEDGNITDIF